MFNNNFENQQAQNEKKFKELAVQFEKMEREYNKLVQELQVDITKIGEYLDNRDNFDDDTWQAMESYKKSLDEKYESVMVQKRDLGQSRASWDLMKNHRPHWIPVR